MKITIKADTDFSDKSIDVVLTNDSLENYNFVEVLLGEECYTFGVEDLFRAAKLFEEIRTDVHKGNAIYDLVEALSGKQ